jgi:hypothetical protein
MPTLAIKVPGGSLGHFLAGAAIAAVIWNRDDSCYSRRTSPFGERKLESVQNKQPTFQLSRPRFSP